MLNVTINKTNMFNPLEGKMNEIIEYFVKFYGEEYRQRITNRLNNTTCIFVPKSNSFLSTYDNVKYFYNDRIKFINNLLFSRIPNYKQKQDGSFQHFNDYKDAAIVKRDLTTGMFGPFTCDKIIDMIQMFDLDNPNNPLENYSHKTLNQWLKNEENKARILQCAQQIIQEYKQHFEVIFNAVNTEKDIALKKVKEYDDIIEAETIKGKEIIIQAIGNYLQKHKKTAANISDEDLNKLANTFYAILQIGANEFIDRNQFSEFEKRQYIALFNYLGFDFGDNMIEYQTNKKLVLTLFNNSIFNQVVKLTKNAAINTCKANPYIQDAFKTIGNLNIKGGNIAVASALLDFACNNSLQAAVAVQYIDNLTNELKYVCIFPDSLSTNDIIIFHELNHVVEADTLLIKKNMYVGKTGFDIMNVKFYNKDFDFKQLKAKTTTNIKLNRDNELISEVINDYFAIQINNLAKKDKKYYTYGKDNPSIYSICHGIMNNFIKKYKKEIIACRMSKNYESFKNYIGPAHFSSLSNLIQNFIIYTQHNEAEVSNALHEICGKTKMSLFSTMANYKSYINKQILLSPSAQNLISCFRQFDYLFNSIDEYTKHTQQNETTKNV